MTETTARSKKTKPSKDELKKMIDEKGYRHTGEHYGVADNTVRRWLLAYGVSLEPKCVLRARPRRAYEKVGDKFMYEEDIIKNKNKKSRNKKSTEDTGTTESKPERQHQVVDLSKIKNRYSANELMEFKAVIEGKIKEGFEAICVLKEGLGRKSENGTDDTSSSGNAFEEGTASIERENMTELIAKKQKHLNALNGALMRVGNGTYGICISTGTLIPKERLLAVPHATKCLEAKRDSDNGKVVTPVEAPVEEDKE
jgi:RNA polymerase-binding transcription factor DksA